MDPWIENLSKIDHRLATTRSEIKELGKVDLVSGEVMFGRPFLKTIIHSSWAFTMKKKMCISFCHRLFEKTSPHYIATHKLLNEHL